MLYISSWLYHCHINRYILLYSNYNLLSPAHFNVSFNFRLTDIKKKNNKNFFIHFYAYLYINIINCVIKNEKSVTVEGLSIACKY